MKGVKDVKRTIGLNVSVLVLCALLVPCLAACGTNPTPLPTETPLPPPPTATPVPPTNTPIPPTDTPPPPPTETPEPANLFKPEGGGFSIVPPYALQETSQTVDTEAGPLEIRMFAAEQGQQAWLVGYSDYPEELVQASDPAAMLAGVRDGAVSNVNGQLVSDVEATLAGYPGREFSATVTQNGQEMVMRERVYLVGNRLYQILVVVPKGEENSQEVEAFFESFQLTAE
jgi:hypothetical protein